MSLGCKYRRFSLTLHTNTNIFNVEHLFMRWFRFVHRARVRALSPQSHRRLPKAPIV